VPKRDPQSRPRRHTGESAAEGLILEATERLLAKRHLQELSVADILDEAGVSRTTFYFYFASKYAVVSALLESRSTDFWAALLPWLQTRGEAAPAELKRTMLNNTQTFRQHGALMRAVVENLDSDAELRDQWLTFIDRIIEAGAAYIDAERAAGNYPPGLDSRVLSAGMLWATERVQYISSLGIDPRLQSAKDVAAFCEVMWRGVVMAGPTPVAPPTARRKR
jgi:AcrR family transcriptional regulator